MKLLSRLLHALRAWSGLDDPSGSHLTPSHGWLLPAPADARRLRQESDVRRSSRVATGARA